MFNSSSLEAKDNISVNDKLYLNNESNKVKFSRSDTLVDKMIFFFNRELSEENTRRKINGNVLQRIQTLLHMTISVALDSAERTKK